MFTLLIVVMVSWVYACVYLLVHLKCGQFIHVNYMSIKPLKNNEQYKEVILGSLCAGFFFLKKLYIEEYLGGLMRLNFTFTLE